MGSDEPERPQGAFSTRYGLIGAFVGFPIASVAVAVVAFDQWSLPKRIAAGLVLGVGSALILTANRLIVVR